MESELQPTIEGALNEVGAVVLSLMHRGFIVTGDLHVCRPNSPQVRPKVTALVTNAQLGRIEIAPEAVTLLATPPAQTETDKRLQWKQMGFTVNLCAVCGSGRMVRNGTCELCLECKQTTGCS